jgi:hypothetical protein
VLNFPLHLLEKPAAVTPRRRPGPIAGRGGVATTFADVLAAKVIEDGRPLYLRPEVRDQLRTMGHELSREDQVRLNETAGRIAAAGGRRALVLGEAVAFVVDLNDREIVGVHDRGELAEAVILDIDSVSAL